MKLFKKYFLWRGLFFLILMSVACNVQAQNMVINSLSGPVTQNEINSFITFMQGQTTPQTPWGAVNGTTGDHNEWADGTPGRELEAMGEMFEISSNMTILNQMISWSDICVSQRNDLMTATNGGQRAMWTGKIDEVWCPNEPSSANAKYAGCENEDTEGHLAYCAKLILKNPYIWNLTVPDGNPFGYGVTYFQRATNYLAKCDQANQEYSLKWFIQSGTSLIIAPSSNAWTVFDENVNANNRQMMFTSGFQRLAEAHEILGDNPALVAQYDAIVKASVSQCLNGMVNFPGNPYTVKGQQTYKWGYDPTSTTGIETTEIHAEYDIIGVWRAFNRTTYGFTLPSLVPFANTMADVIYLGTNTFAGNVDGSGGTQSPIYSGWIYPADWNPQVYTTVAGVAYTNGWYKTSADIETGILYMKNRRYLEFSATPTPASEIVTAGSGTTFTVAVAPLGRFTNTVSLTVNGLPSGATASFTASSINTAALNLASTNVTLSVSTSSSTPPGTYQLNVIATSGSVSHTNAVSLIVGTFALSATPPSQTISAGDGTSYTIGITTNNGFSGTVSFGISGLPANASDNFSPGSFTGSGSSTLSVITAGNTPAGNYTLTIMGTNGTVVSSASVTLTVLAATPVWTGGSGSDNNWSDIANWGSIAISPDVPLVFNGGTRLNDTNDTAAATIYSNIVFTSSAGAFVLNGNPITVGGNITNNSANPQTINFGLNFSGSFTLNGAGGPLIINGGLTNHLGAPGFTTLTLTGIGQLANTFNSATRPGGTNVILLNDNTADWTLVDNANSAPINVPWVFEVNNGTFNFGTSTSAPNLTSSTPDNTPSDNLVGNTSGGTATFNMVNGTLTTSSRIDTATATSSTGIINQTGGTMNIGVQFQGANGQNPGEVSIVNVSGGTMNIQASGPFYVASRGTGSLTIGGSGVVDCGHLDISRNASGNSFGSAGTVNLDGGTLMVTAVTNVSANQQTGGTPTAAFNFNGGTLMAKPGAVVGFFQGSAVTPVTPITTLVQVGGAVIDDGGNTIIIAEPLQHDSSLGTDSDGGLTKLDSGTLTLTAVSTYNGDTLVNSGTLALSGAGSIADSDNITVAAGATLDASVRSDATLTLTAGQTLSGNGTIKGVVVAGTGATFAPGNSTGTLVLNNSLTLTSGSTTVIAINKSVMPSNALAQVAGNLIYGGTLVITNLGTIAFSAGDSFQLFSAANYTGSFTNIVPVIPGINLAWDTNGLPNGILNVVSSPTPPPQINAMTLAGNNLVTAGTNGVPNWTYCVLGTTNLALPASQWQPVATNNFDNAGNFTFTNALQSNVAQQFYMLQMQ